MGALLRAVTARGDEEPTFEMLVRIAETGKLEK
jgi:hypothetical protein